MDELKDKKMMERLIRYICMLIVWSLLISLGYLIRMAREDIVIRPSNILGFYPAFTEIAYIQAAQAELCRKGYDIGVSGVDGKWGKNSALALSKYIEDIEKGK